MAIFFELSQPAGLQETIYEAFQSKYRGRLVRFKLKISSKAGEKKPPVGTFDAVLCDEKLAHDRSCIKGGLPCFLLRDMDTPNLFELGDMGR